MKIELLVSRQELEVMLEDVRDDADTMEVIQGANNTLKVKFSLDVLPDDFAEMAVKDTGINMEKMKVETVTMTPDGSVGLLLVKKA